MWRFVSHHPDMPAAVCDVVPDDAWQTALEHYMPIFLEELDEAKAWMVEWGAPPVEVRGVEAVDIPAPAEVPVAGSWPEGW